MMKNKKIGTKMLLVILAVSLVSLFVIATLSYTEMLNLTQYSMDANTRLGLSASEKSKTALKNQAEEYITKIANEQALKSDAILSKIQSAGRRGKLQIYAASRGGSHKRTGRGIVSGQ